MGTRGMAAGELERFRISLETAIAGSSLRAVAESVGMSPSGLTKLLDGARPYGKTVERLRLWHSRHAGLNAVPPEHIADQLRRLSASLGLPDTDSAVGDVLDAVERICATRGMPPPEWVQRVRGAVR